MTTVSADGRVGDGSRLQQILIMLILLAIAALMLRNLSFLLAFASDALSYPYSFDYGEGIVWQQMRDMLRGTAYGPLGVYPAIVYHYPPVFHLATAATAALTGADELAAGRAVEVASTLATAVLAAILTMQAIGRETPAWIRGGCGAFAALFFLNCGPVLAWAPLMRVDMLAGALGLLGMVFAVRAIDRPVWIYAAALAFVLSLYTKQIGIAPPMAAFAVLLLADRRTALRGLIASTALGLIVLGALSWMTDGGFVRHIFLYNVNRIDLARFVDLVELIGKHLPLVLLAAVGAVSGWRLIRQIAGGTVNPTSFGAGLKADRAALAVAMLLAVLAIKTLMLPTILKSGSNVNYLIEWLSAVAIFAGIAMRPVIALAFGNGLARPDRTAFAVGLIALIAVAPQVAAVPVWGMSKQAMAERANALAPVVQQIASASKPVISDDMTLLIRAGRNVAWEPAIAAELAHTGVYDEAGFVRMIKAGAFAFFVTEGKAGVAPFDERYNAPVAAAIKAAFPHEEEIGRFVLHLPQR
jgi:hypothetical protein